MLYHLARYGLREKEVRTLVAVLGCRVRRYEDGVDVLDPLIGAVLDEVDQLDAVFVSEVLVRDEDLEGLGACCGVLDKPVGLVYGFRLHYIEYRREPAEEVFHDDQIEVLVVDDEDPEFPEAVQEEPGVEFVVETQVVLLVDLVHGRDPARDDRLLLVRALRLPDGVGALQLALLNDVDEVGLLGLDAEHLLDLLIEDDIPCGWNWEEEEDEAGWWWIRDWRCCWEIYDC